MNWKNWLWGWKGILVATIILGITGVLIWLLTEHTWAWIGSLLTIAIPNLAFNWKTLFKWAEGIGQTARVGWRQMALNQLEKQERIQRLIRLENLQRNNIDSYFRTDVESVSYKGLATTAPHINLKVRFFNLLILQCKVKSWKLRFDRPDTHQMVCKGHQCQLRPQEGEVTNSKINECQSQPLHIRLDIESTVADLIREASKDKEIVGYRIAIDWEVELERIGSHRYKDELSHDDVPNLNR